MAFLSLIGGFYFVHLRVGLFMRKEAIFGEIGIRQYLSFLGRVNISACVFFGFLHTWPCYQV